LHSQEIATLRVEQTKKELKRLSLAIIIWIVSGYTMALMGVIASIRAPQALPLPDLGFELFSFLPVPEILTNAIMSIIALCTIGRVLIHPLRVIILKRMLLVHSVVMSIRAIFVVATSLPDPYPLCKAYALSRNIFLEALLRQTTAGFFVCGDVFFSGHIAICVICLMVWVEYTKEVKLKWFVLVLCIMEGCVITATKFHYTIDVIIGAYLAFRCWRTYHNYHLQMFNWLESAPIISKSTHDEMVQWINAAPVGKYTLIREATVIKPKAN